MLRQWNRVRDHAVGRHRVADTLAVLRAELVAVDLVLGHDTQGLQGLLLLLRALRCVVTITGTVVRARNHRVGPECTAFALRHLGLRRDGRSATDNALARSRCVIGRRCGLFGIGAEFRLDGQELLGGWWRQVQLTDPPQSIHSVRI